FPYNCRSGECGECLARLVSGRVRALPAADPAIYNDTNRANGEILACMCYPESDLELSLPAVSSSADFAPVGQHDGRISSINRLQPTIYEVVVEVEAGLHYAPGQYFDWQIPGISPDRSYSAANRAGEGRVVFHVKVHEGGQVSNYLQHGGLCPGDSLTLKGPYGRFGLSENTDMPAIMVAGGTGLAPILALLEENFARSLKRPVTLYFGGRSPSELYHLDRLALLVERYEHFKLVACVQEANHAASWNGATGLVTDVLRQTLIDGFGHEAYLCGPPGMIDAAGSVLTTLGVDNADIYADSFLPVA
ncbi:MAG: 2Fe-2S iron-sulfur cluster binding domain-containing protein, partial [Pusillimonas sp.]|nr:2Fe-2S iron-sulfur cluster binding domain-containing protein [Pusillimonas sp.]